MATTLPAGAEMPIRSQSVRTPRRPPSSRPDPLPRSESSTRAEASRPHRRSSQRSTTAPSVPSPRQPQHPDMPAPAANNTGGPSDETRERTDAQAHRTSKHRYRTVIPAPSGNYAFIKTIGQGSMGKVKLAKKEGTNELVRPPCAILRFQIDYPGCLTNTGFHLGTGRLQDN